MFTSMKLPLRSVIIAALVAPCSALPLSAQAGSDIHVGDLLLGPSSVEIRGVYNATDRPGYDNQPWFAPDGASLLYARIDDERPDIYRYVFADRSSVRLTETPGGDLSPSAFGETGEFLALSNGSVDDGPWGVWRFSASGEPIAPLIDPVYVANYYGIANEQVVLGWLAEGDGVLQRADRNDGTVTFVRDRVAPSPPQRIPGDSGMSIAEPNFLGQIWIKRLDLDSWEVTPIVPVVGQGWHYAWTPDGRLLMADGEAIFLRDPDTDEDWREVARFPGMGSISRVVVSADGTRIAFVAEGS